MLYLFWNLLNIGLFLFFLLVCFRAVRLVRERWGLFAAIILVVGLLSFIGHSNGGGISSSKGIRTWEFGLKDSTQRNGPRHTERIVLEDQWASQYNLNISVHRSNDSADFAPRKAWSTFTGLGGGIAWMPQELDINHSDRKGAFQYKVEGVEEWSLLGFTVYAVTRTFQGTVDIK